MRTCCINMANTLQSSKKLLIFDLRGVLCDRIFVYDQSKRAERLDDIKIGNFYIHKRPYCEAFLAFCFEHFMVGVWSSATKRNEEPVVNYLFGELKNKLAFEWHQDNCTPIPGLMDPENKNKPVFLKELSKVWETHTPSLLQNENFGPTNTLLLDDTPYKAIRNPAYTAVFLSRYSADDVTDMFLKDTLQPYLQRLAKSSDVQSFVENNPFGEPALNSSSPHWNYFKHLFPEKQLTSPCLNNLEMKDSKILSYLLSDNRAFQLDKESNEHKGECIRTQNDKAGASSPI